MAREEWDPFSLFYLLNGTRRRRTATAPQQIAGLKRDIYNQQQQINFARTLAARRQDDTSSSMILQADCLKFWLSVSKQSVQARAKRNSTWIALGFRWRASLIKKATQPIHKWWLLVATGSMTAVNWFNEIVFRARFRPSRKWAHVYTYCWRAVDLPARPGG